MKPEEEALSWLLLGLLVGLPVAAVGAAVLLRAACFLCRAEVPKFGKALGVVVVAGLITAVAWAVPMFCIGLMTAARPPDPDQAARASWMAQLIFLLWAMAISSAVYAYFLKVTFGRAFLIRLTELAVSGALSLLVTGIVIGVLWFKDRPQVQSPAEIKQAAADAAAAAERTREKLLTQADTRTREGNEFARGGRLPEAADAFREASDKWQRLASLYPREDRFSREHLQCQLSLAEALYRSAAGKEAEEAYREAVQLGKQLATDFPAKLECSRDLGTGELGLGDVLRRAGRAPEAEPPLRNALAIFEHLTVQAPTEREYQRQLARCLNELAHAQSAVGRDQEAMAQSNKALALSKTLAGEQPGEPRDRHAQARALAHLGHLYLRTGRKADSEKAYREALALAKSLTDSFPASADCRRALATVDKGLGMLLYVTGRASEAEPPDREAIALWKQLALGKPLWPDDENDLAGTMVNLAAVLRDRKDAAGARELLEQAAPHHQAALTATAANPLYRLYFRSNRLLLSEVLIQLRDHAAAALAAQDLLKCGVEPAQDAYDAARCLARCVALVEQPKWLSLIHESDLTRTYCKQAVQALREAVQKGYRQPARKNVEPDFEPFRALVRDHIERGDRLLSNGTSRSNPAYWEAAEIWELLVALLPAVPEYRHELALARFNLAEVNHRFGSTEPAQADYQKALGLFRGLAVEFPDRPDYRRFLAECLGEIGGLCLRFDQLKEAEAAFREALATEQKLAADSRDAPGYRLAAAAMATELATLLLQTGQSTQAQATLREAEAAYRELMAGLAGKTDHRPELARSHQDFGAFLLRTGRSKEAEAELRQALSIRKALAEAFPHERQHRLDLARCHTGLAQFFHQTSHRSEEETARREALELWKRLADNYAAAADERLELARCYAALGALLREKGSTQEAESAYRKAVAVDEKYRYVVAFENDLAETMLRLALLLREHKEMQRARDLLEKAVPHHETVLLGCRSDRKYHQAYRNTLLALSETRLLLGDHRQARNAAATILYDPYGVAADYYRIACLFARSAALAKKDTKLTDTLREGLVSSYGYDAVAALREARKTGFQDVARLESDPDLNPLRSRDDFKSLLAELKARGR
jgi:tetratricopeptide (TPR) repeat protein